LRFSKCKIHETVRYNRVGDRLGSGNGKFGAFIGTAYFTPALQPVYMPIAVVTTVELHYVLYKYPKETLALN
jgi:hypothetical protein